MSFWLAAPLSGIVGAIAMVAFLYALHALRVINGDMLKAVGSWMTRKDEGSLQVGLLLHLLIGALFGYIYVGIWVYVDTVRYIDFLFSGILFGFAHGVAFSIAMVILVAEHHPIPRFRKAGFGIALGHLVAHVVFGWVVGATANTLMN